MFKIIKYHKRRINCARLYCNYSSISSESDFEKEFAKAHIPASKLQYALLGIGSAVMSLVDPYTRGDMVAVCGETTGRNALQNMLRSMENSDEGSRILRELPRVNSNTIDMEKLKKFPDGTFGKAYINFLQSNKVTPDSRCMVQFVDDVKLAYVIQRYREIHDFVHAILNMPISIMGEVTVKWVEAFQTKLPMCFLAAFFGPLKIEPSNREIYVDYHLPWAIKTGLNSAPFMNMYFEKRWDQPFSEMLHELNIKPLIIPSCMPQ